MRKLLCFLAIMLLVLNAFNVNADSMIDNKQVLAEKIFGKEGLNICTYSHGEDFITRAEMARIMYNISDGGKYVLYEFKDNPRNEEFKDVDETHWAYKYIETLRLEGVFNGDGNGNFNPDEPCKYVDFVKTAVFVTGYSAYYGTKGYGDTYFEKCYKSAQQMSISFSDFTIDSYITANDVYILLFDMLFVPQIRNVGFTHPYAVYETSYNLLKLNYEIKMNLWYFKKNDENLYLSSDGALNFKGMVCNDGKFENGYAICFYKTNEQTLENDIVLCVSISEKLYQSCVEKYDKYKIESVEYDKYYQ